MIKFFPNKQIFIEFGPFQIAWYAIFILSGALLAYHISLKNIKELGYKEEKVENLFYGALLLGILGARIWYVLFFDFKSYLSNPMKIFAVWEGGLAIQGGLIAGFLYGYYYTKKHKINFLLWADLIIPNILLAQAIGRWGNFMNQEAYGGIVSESYYRFFPHWFKEMMYINGEFRQPTFLFESIGNLIGWILIVFVLKRKSELKRGDLSFAYLMWYGTIRFFIEKMRTDSLTMGSLRIARVISILFIILGALGYFGFYDRFKPKKVKPLILFDFDGTLMDTEPVIKESFRRTLIDFDSNIQLTKSQIDSFIGPSLYDIFSSFTNEEEQIQHLISRYQTIQQSLVKEMVKPMPYAIETLEQLKDQGYILGIVSNRMGPSMRRMLDDFDMEQYFDVVLGIDDFEIPKPSPKGINEALIVLDRGRDQLIYVGDVLTDIQAGARAGAFTIAYNFDNMVNEDIHMEKPNRVIEDLRDILEILKEDHEWTKTMM